jgi:putative flippase GtrA
VANVGVASYLFSQKSGAIAAALGGIAVGAVWNYVVTAEYPWRYAARMK